MCPSFWQLVGANLLSNGLAAMTMGVAAALLIRYAPRLLVKGGGS